MENPIIRMQEQADTANAEYSDWIDTNAESLLEEYQQDLDWGDMPLGIQNNIHTDDADEWGSAFERWLDEMKVDDIPNDWLSDRYESYCEGDGGYEERF